MGRGGDGGNPSHGEKTENLNCQEAAEEKVMLVPSARLPIHGTSLTANPLRAASRTSSETETCERRPSPLPQTWSRSSPLDTPAFSIIQLWTRRDGVGSCGGAGGTLAGRDGKERKLHGNKKTLVSLSLLSPPTDVFSPPLLHKLSRHWLAHTVCLV